MPDVDMNVWEAIYSDALAGFAQVFDRESLDLAIECGDGDEYRAIEADTKQMWWDTLESQMDRFEDVDAADIRSAIREAASELCIPTEWTDT